MFPSYVQNKFVHLYKFCSVACLAALQRHGECLALVNKRLEEETDNPDLFIMRARLHELFRNVSTVINEHWLLSYVQRGQQYKNN